MSISRRLRGKTVGWYLSIPVMLVRKLRHEWNLISHPTTHRLSVYRIFDPPRPSTASSTGPLIPKIGPPRILIVRHGGIGDIVTILPALRLLRRHLPNAQIDVLTRVHCKPFCDDIPEIDNTYVVPQLHETSRRNLYDGVSPGAMIRFGLLVRKLRSMHYDVSIEMIGMFAYARWLALVARARRCVAVMPCALFGPTWPFETDYSDRVSDRLALSPDIMANTVDTAWAAAKYVLEESAISLDPNEDSPLALSRFSTPAVARSKVDLWRKAVGLGDRYAVIHPGAADPQKTWPAERFARIADYLVEVCGWDVVVTGATHERPLAESVRDQSKQRDRVFPAAGVFRFVECGALFEKAQLVVTVDGAAMHLADAVGSRLVALFLPWPRYTRYLPYSQPDAAILAPGAPPEEPPFVDRTRYIDNITVGAVIDAIERKLSGFDAERVRSAQ